MFKKLRKDLKALSEEVELSASTGQEVDLDELNEDEEVDAPEAETEKELTGEETLEEMISFLEDEVIEMGAEDAERLMTEDDDEDEEEKEDEEESETLEEGVVERDLARGAKLGEKAAKFIAKQEAKAGVKSVKYAVREATVEEVARLAKKRQFKVTLLFGLAGRLYNKKVSEKYEVGNKASVISVEVKKENGEVSVNVFSGITNLKPSEVKVALERKLQIARKDKSLKEDDEVVVNDEKEKEVKLDTFEEAYSFLFEDEEVEVADKEVTTVDSSDELLDKEIQEMISFLEDDEEEVEEPTEEEIKEKEKEAEQAVAEALNAVRALRKTKKARR